MDNSNLIAVIESNPKSRRMPTSWEYSVRSGSPRYFLRATFG